MAKKPITGGTPEELNQQSHPVGNKRYYLKEIFFGDETAYNDFVKFWKEVEEEGVEFVYKIVWVRFREYWDQDESGYWVQRLQPETEEV